MRPYPVRRVQPSPGLLPSKRMVPLRRCRPDQSARGRSPGRLSGRGFPVSPRSLDLVLQAAAPERIDISDVRGHDGHCLCGGDCRRGRRDLANRSQRSDGQARIVREVQPVIDRVCRSGMDRDTCARSEPGKPAVGSGVDRNVRHKHLSSLATADNLQGTIRRRGRHGTSVSRRTRRVCPVLHTMERRSTGPAAAYGRLRPRVG